MKLIIQIPCYNEEESLPETLTALPREMPGFDSVEWLIIDDGSSDNTIKVAEENGVDHIVKFTHNKGLARAFMAGLDTAIDLGADVVVNTDADNQYCASSIPKLVQPILDGSADIVVGARPIKTIKHFSLVKKLLQLLGSWVIRIISNTKIPDAPSGFRAISRNAAMQLVVFNQYTYTLETIIQAGHKNIGIVSVPIEVNGETRPSRLFKSMFGYIRRSVYVIIRIFIIYKPFKFFVSIGSLIFLAGLFLGIRYLVFMFNGEGAGHLQSLILTSILLGVGFQTLLVAVLADLLAANRRLIEDVRYLVKKRK